MARLGDEPRAGDEGAASMLEGEEGVRADDDYAKGESPAGLAVSPSARNLLVCLCRQILEVASVRLLQLRPCFPCLHSFITAYR